MSKYDDDDDYDSDNYDEENNNNDGGISTQDIYDPERSERINRMMEASQNSTFDVLQDNQVTDFVLRMAEKNHMEEHEHDLDESNTMNSMKSRRQQQRQQKEYKERSPDEYPPGEAYAGDEIGEEVEIPSYDPKDDNAISYGRLCCVACALVIVMVATSVIILLFVVLLDKEENNKAFYDGMILPIAPNNLKDICNLDNLKGMQGELDCRDPCMKAACCWETGDKGQDPICWQSHPLECAPYESCVNLLSAGSDPRPTSTVPRAPDGVDSCNPTTTESVNDVLACEKACSFGTCCWRTDDAAAAGSACPTDPNCLEYKPCEILNMGGSGGSALSSGIGGSTATTTAPMVIPTAAGNLDEICSQSSTQLECQEMCQQAVCCWKMAVSTFEGPIGGIITETVLGECSTRSECSAYKPCQQLNWSDTPETSSIGPATTHIVPKAPSNLADVCDPGAGSVDAYELCMETCHAAACCWKTSTTSYTGSDGKPITETLKGTCSFKEECSGYESCNALPGATVIIADGTTTVAPASSIPEPPDNLRTICTEQSIETCRDVCNQALCCWKIATATHTDAQGESITESIRGTCSAHSECQPYSPCLDLPEATSSGTNTVSEAPANLDSVCNPPADQMDNIPLCVEYCHEATCCWKTAQTSYEDANNKTITTTTPGTCSQRAECEPYKACSTLEDNSLSPSTPALPDSTPAPVASSAPATSPSLGTGYTASTIYDACFNHMDQPNAVKTLCEEVCEAGACCFQPEVDCESELECAKYEPCSKLVQAADDAMTQPTAIETACQNTDDLADCVSLCSKVTCCFTSNLEKSCDKTAPGTVCSEFTDCEVLYLTEGGR